TYTATITWKNDGGGFLAGKYSRAHTWKFDCGIELEASASPSIVPLPYSRQEAVDPEEAYVAAISSCHMLTFLYLASKKQIGVSKYTDEAIGVMEPDARGQLYVSRVILRPQIVFEGETPPPELFQQLNYEAHQQCYIH